MQIEILQVFCDLVETTSFSKAAQRNKITQSAVSQQIRKLEQRYGVSFFERSKKTFSVTPGGEIFHNAARQILSLYRNIGNQINVLKDVVEGQVRVSTIGSIGFHDLPPRLTYFREKFPDVALKITYNRSNEVYNDVLEGRVDLGLVAHPSKRNDLLIDTFSTERLVLACSPAHELAARDQIEITDLDGREIIAFEPDQPTRRSLDRLFRSAGVQVTTHLEFDNIETAKRAIEVTEGMSIVPESSVQHEVKAGTICAATIENEGFWRPLAIIRRRGSTNTQAMQAFSEHLQDESTRH